jgi:hypothetical protein
MERDRPLVLNPANHPDPRVQRIGFDLSDPYVEQCWSAVVGPSAVLLLRRAPALWTAEVPAEVEPSAFSRSLGLGAGVGANSRLASTLERITRFGLARRTDDGLDVFLEVPPLAPHQLERLPGWTQATHERLFAARLASLEGAEQRSTPVSGAAIDLHRLRTDATRNAPSHQAMGL